MSILFNNLLASFLSSLTTESCWMLGETSAAICILSVSLTSHKYPPSVHIVTIEKFITSRVSGVYPATRAHYCKLSYLSHLSQTRRHSCQPARNRWKSIITNSYSPYEWVGFNIGREKPNILRADWRSIIIIIKCIAVRMCSSPSTLFLSPPNFQSSSLSECILLKHSNMLPIDLNVSCRSAGGFIISSVSMANKSLELLAIVGGCINFISELYT
jgi:hypothetical protein